APTRRGEAEISSSSGRTRNKGARLLSASMALGREMRRRFLLSDLHETLLNELNRSRHSVRIHLDACQQILVSPTVDPCGRPAELNMHAALLQIGYQVLVGIACEDVAIRVVSPIVQSYVPGIRMEDCDNLGAGAPAFDVVPDEFHVKDR